MDEARFKTWFEAAGYRTSAANQIVRRIERLDVAFGDGVGLKELLKKPINEKTLRTYATFLAAEPKAVGGAFDHAVVRAGLPPVELKKRRGRAETKKLQVSFDEGDWRELIGHLEDDHSPEGTVLLVCAATGVRIGDALRIKRPDLRAAWRSGVLEIDQKGGSVRRMPLAGAEDVWKRLEREWKTGASVARWLCPDSDAEAEGGGCAYQRVFRHLQAVGNNLGLKGRIHLHRMRRTVATRALRRTHDIHLVSQLLGHKSITSTQRYVNELRTEEVGALQKELRG